MEVDHSDSQKYIHAADDLRRAIRLNRQDHDFANRPGARRTIYLSDTNVAVNSLRADGSVTPALRALLTPDALKWCDALTRRYMFSACLPGQQGSMYVMPTHWNELVAQLHNFSDQQRDVLSRLNLLRPDQIADLVALASEPEKIFEKAREFGLEQILNLFMNAAEPSRLLDAMFLDRQTEAGDTIAPRIQPIEHRDDLWSPVFGEVRTSEVREWAASLAASVGRGRRERSRNIDADAEALASIQALYRNTPHALGPGATTRFLFITSDFALIDAYIRRRSVLKAEGIPNFIRHPMVYSPLINFSDIQRAIAKGGPADPEYLKVSAEVQLAVSSLFPQDARTMTTAASEWQMNFKENVTRWSEAAETIALTGGSLLSLADGDRDVRHAQEHLATLFESTDAVAAAKEAVVSKINEIQRNHTRNVSYVTLKKLIARIPSSRNADVPSIRAPMIIRRLDVTAPLRRDEERLDSERLEDVLRRLKPRSVTDTDEWTAYVWKLFQDHWNEPKFQILGCMIFMADSAWMPALACAETAIELLTEKRSTEKIIWREARYAKALALRMLLRSPSDVEAASDALKENLREFYEHQIDQLRDRVELSALMMSACIGQAIVSSVESASTEWRQHARVLEGNLVHTFDHEMQYLDESIKMLEHGHLLQVLPALRITKSVIGQAAINRLGAELFRHYFGEKISALPPHLPGAYTHTRSILDELKGYRLPDMGHIYLSVTEAVLGKQVDMPTLIAKLEELAKVGRAQGDIEEYGYLLAQMRRLAASGEEKLAAVA